MIQKTIGILIGIVITVAMLLVFVNTEYRNPQGLTDKECSDIHTKECNYCHNKNMSFWICSGFCGDSDGSSHGNYCEFDLDKNCESDIEAMGCVT